MATKLSVREFLDNLASSELVDPTKIAPYRVIPGDRLVHQMIDDGVLTLFQAKQVIAGQHRSLFIRDKYKVVDVLGKGGMGRVYLCEHLILQRLVAVKMMYRAREQKPGALERFMHEARAAAKFDHPNLARVFDVDVSPNGPYIVMEYVDGANLHDLVVGQGPLSPQHAAHYVRQAATGLQQAHQAGLVHRDIKPGNLMLDRFGVVKLLDLGLARYFDSAPDEGLTSEFDPQAILGTADFIAPEQALASSRADIRADIYSLGCSLYFLLTGRLPAGEGTTMHKLLRHQSREPQSITEIRSDVPPQLVTIVERMIRKNPSDRYQTPAEVVEALACCTSDEISPPSAKQMPSSRLSNYRLGLCSPRSSQPRSDASRGTASLSCALHSTDVEPSGLHETPSAESFGLPDSTGRGSSSGAPKSRSGAPQSASTPSWEIAAAESSEAHAPPPSSSTNVTPPIVVTPAARVAATPRKNSAVKILGFSLLTAVVLATAGVSAWSFLGSSTSESAPSRPVTRASRSEAVAEPPSTPEKAAPHPTTPEKEATPPLAAPPPAVATHVLRAGGSSFVKPIMDHWGRVYLQEHGRKLDYTSAGSSKGVDGVIAGFLDFGCSDAPLTDQQMVDSKEKVVHVPLVMGAVVPTYNLTDEQGELLKLQFTGPLLANIYLGKVTHWNDPSIAANNPGIALPDLEITVVGRKDGSGTTNIWTDYLAKASSAWKTQVGVGNVVKWPVGMQAEKNNGVADLVSRTSGAIGYVELNYALANNLGYGPVRNKDGAYVAPTSQSITAAAVGALESIPEDFRYSLTDSPGANAYPIVGTTWALLNVELAPEKREEVVAFVRWATSEGQKHAAALNYGELPPELVRRIHASLDKLH